MGFDYADGVQGSWVQIPPSRLGGRICPATSSGFSSFSDPLYVHQGAGITPAVHRLADGRLRSSLPSRGRSWHPIALGDALSPRRPMPVTVAPLRASATGGALACDPRRRLVAAPMPVPIEKVTTRCSGHCMVPESPAYLRRLPRGGLRPVRPIRRPATRVEKARREREAFA